MWYPYNDVIRELKRRWNIPRLKKGLRIIWIMGMKRIFVDGFTAENIFSVYDEAMRKSRWPMRTPFFRRIHDLLLLQRKQREQTPTMNRGLEGIKELLRAVPKS